MGVATTEHELIERMKRFVKAELKRADLTYEELASMASQKPKDR
jgi:hypothetical protein